MQFETDGPVFTTASFRIVLCLARPEAVSQAKPGQVDGFMTALAWPGVLKSQSQAVKPRLFGEYNLSGCIVCMLKILVGK
jgi:hypothetical protein